MEIMLPILILFGAFYFILIRPVLRQQREQRRQMADIRIGDEVLTTGGLLATVVEIDTPEEGPVRLTLELGPGLRVRAVPGAVLQRVTARESEGSEQPAAGRE